MAADVKAFQGIALTRQIPDTAGFGLPLSSEVEAAGQAAPLKVMKDATDGSWDTFVALVATAGYINVGIDGSQANHQLIPILKKTAFPA